MFNAQLKFCAKNACSVYDVLKHLLCTNIAHEFPVCCLTLTVLVTTIDALQHFETG